ncbi:MAG: hypothetical protein ACYTXA_24595 [Nostoc sp.]
MNQTNCPRCDSTRLQYQENYGYWDCEDCGHTWGFDEDDPDYDEEIVDYDGDTGQAFINGHWVVVSPRAWARWNGESYGE